MGENRAANKHDGVEDASVFDGDDGRQPRAGTNIWDGTYQSWFGYPADRRLARRKFPCQGHFKGYLSLYYVRCCKKYATVGEPTMF